jgi:hypothetical protein
LGLLRISDVKLVKTMMFNINILVRENVNDWLWSPFPHYPSSPALRGLSCMLALLFIRIGTGGGPSSGGFSTVSLRPSAGSFIAHIGFPASTRGRFASSAWKERCSP